MNLRSGCPSHSRRPSIAIQSYADLDPDLRSELLQGCHVVGSRLDGTGTFYTSNDDNELLFRAEPNRKILNLAFQVCEGEAWPRLATLEVFKTRGLQICGPDGREQSRVVDPQEKLDQFVQAILEGGGSGYALVSDAKGRSVSSGVAIEPRRCGVRASGSQG